MTEQPVPWDQMKDSAQECVVEAIRKLADGFTGRIEFHCSDGGVGNLRFVSDYKPGSGRKVVAKAMDDGR